MTSFKIASIVIAACHVLVTLTIPGTALYCFKKMEKRWEVQDRHWNNQHEQTMKVLDESRAGLNALIDSQNDSRKALHALIEGQQELIRRTG